MHHQSAPLVWAAIDWELTTLSLGLLFLLFVGFVLVMRVRRWQRNEEDITIPPRRQLEQYRALLDQGLLGQDEFEKLRQQLEQRTLGSDPSSNRPPP